MNEASEKCFEHDVEQLCTFMKQEVSAGSIIKFGRYPQKTRTVRQTVKKGIFIKHYREVEKSIPDETPYPIEWIVLDIDWKERKLLIISKYGLDAQAYNTEYAFVTWETCTLRKWLNNDFYNKAFSKIEQSAILSTEVDNSTSQNCGVNSPFGSNNTQDKIFLLSCAEASKYFCTEYWKNKGAMDNTKSRVQPTEYAIAQHAYVNSKHKTSDGAASGWWWLRSPGHGRGLASDVETDGSLYDRYNVNCDSAVVRPALWVDLSLIP